MLGFWENRKRQASSLPAGNEGVGEHVRTSFHLGFISPVKLRIPGDPHRTKKTCFFCRTGFRKSELIRKVDPAV
jgi:hypothetical protein